MSVFLGGVSAGGGVQFSRVRRATFKVWDGLKEVHDSDWSSWVVIGFAINDAFVHELVMENDSGLVIVGAWICWLHFSSAGMVEGLISSTLVGDLFVLRGGREVSSSPLGLACPCCLDILRAIAMRMSAEKTRSSLLHRADG